MKVELGAGYAPHPDFDVHVDISPNAPIEVVADVRTLPFPDDSIEELRAVDILEHISYRHTEDVLTEWARVLQPAGRLFVQCPNAERIMSWRARRPHNLDDGLPPELADKPTMTKAAWRLLGGQEDGNYARTGDDFRWNAHYALFDDDSLTWYLERAGLSVESLTTNPFPNLQCVAVKA